MDRTPESYSEPRQTSKMKLSSKILKTINHFAKKSEMFDRVVSASLSITTKFSSNEKNTVATKIVNYSV